MWEHGTVGISSGWRSLWVWHAATYFVTSSISVGHQNHYWIANEVLLAPGWHEKGEEWAQCITVKLNSVGTNRRLGGQAGGRVQLPCASFTFSSTSQNTIPNTAAWKNKWGFLLWWVRAVEARKGISLYVFLPWSVGQMKIKSIEE